MLMTVMKGVRTLGGRPGRPADVPAPRGRGAAPAVADRGAGATLDRAARSWSAPSAAESRFWSLSESNRSESPSETVAGDAERDRDGDRDGDPERDRCCGDRDGDGDRERGRVEDRDVGAGGGDFELRRRRRDSCDPLWRPWEDRLRDVGGSASVNRRPPHPRTADGEGADHTDKVCAHPAGRQRTSGGKGVVHGPSQIHASHLSHARHEAGHHPKRSAGHQPSGRVHAHHLQNENNKKNIPDRPISTWVQRRCAAGRGGPTMGSNRPAG